MALRADRSQQSWKVQFDINFGSLFEGFIQFKSKTVERNVVRVTLEWLALERVARLDFGAVRNDDHP